MTYGRTAGRPVPSQFIAFHRLIPDEEQIKKNSACTETLHGFLDHLIFCDVCIVLVWNDK
jgi:hypothetical protein